MGRVGHSYQVSLLRQGLAHALREPTVRQPGGRHRPRPEALQEHPVAAPSHKSQGAERAADGREPRGTPTQLEGRAAFVQTTQTNAS